MGAMRKRGNGLFVAAGLALRLVQGGRDPVSCDVLGRTVRAKQGMLRGASASSIQVPIHFSVAAFFAF